jgi:uncharacterized protein with PIN domain
VNTITIRFYAELNHFLPANRRQVDFECTCESGTSIKHLIEALGVPHTEVDLILVTPAAAKVVPGAAGVDGAPVDFTYQVQDGDRISVYPVFESLDLSPLARLRPQPLREPRFVLDAHLGKLAVFLRMLGFDALYRNDYGDEELARISSQEQRILLTRDRGLLKRSLVTHGYCVRQDDPRQQIVEVLQRFDLYRQVTPFKRCLRCNGLLERVDKDAILDQLQPDTRQYFQEFHRCADCGHIYWKGSHYQRMQQMIESVLAMPH